MDRRAKGVRAHRRPECSADIVMVCQRPDEIRQVSQVLSELGAGKMAVYENVESLALNAPAGAVSLVIVAGDLQKELLTHSLRWLKRWRPSAVAAVVANSDQIDLEIAARSEGAGYFVRPVATEQWRSMVQHVLKRTATSPLRVSK